MDPGQNVFWREDPPVGGGRPGKLPCLYSPSSVFWEGEERERWCLWGGDTGVTARRLGQHLFFGRERYFFAVEVLKKLWLWAVWETVLTGDLLSHGHVHWITMDGLDSKRGNPKWTKEKHCKNYKTTKTLKRAFFMCRSGENTLNQTIPMCVFSRCVDAGMMQKCFFSIHHHGYCC